MNVWQFVALVLVIVVIVPLGIVTAGVSAPLAQETSAPTDAPATTSPPATTTSPPAAAPSIEMRSPQTEELQLGENATIEIEVTRADGTPAEDVTVTLQSLGYPPGKFIVGPTVRTDENGEAAAVWHFTEPHMEEELQIRSLGTYPPAEPVSLYATATVDGETAESLVTIKINPTCQDCHKFWRDTSPPTNETDGEN